MYKHIALWGLLILCVNMAVHAQNETLEGTFYEILDENEPFEEENLLVLEVEEPARTADDLFYGNVEPFLPPPRERKASPAAIIETIKSLLTYPKLTLTGEMVGMVTLGLYDDAQVIVDPDSLSSKVKPGIYNGVETGKNGYYTMLNFGILYNPVSYVDLYIKFLARYRPGSSYIPLQHAEASTENFDVSVDNAYVRVNSIEGLGFDFPLGLWLKAGKFDTTPANYQNISRYGAESVLEKLRTKNTYAFQAEAAWPWSWGETRLSITTNSKLNEEIEKLWDTDGNTNQGLNHGEAVLIDRYTFPLHISLKVKDIKLPVVNPLSVEALYVYNAEHIYSGHSFGLGAGLSVPINRNLLIPAGLSVVFYEKNIDPFAGTALGKNSLSYEHPYATDYDSGTISFRQVVRVGAAAGIRVNFGDISGEANLGFSVSQFAHFYRETADVLSFSLDLLAEYQNRFFIGGGLFLGTLKDVTWKTKSDVAQLKDAFEHTFTLEENMGWEIFGGLRFGKSRFVLGYNCNRGIAMSHSLESIPEGQIKYKQKDSNAGDGLFESGGFFTKLAVTW